METVFYTKQGRKYVPVSYYDHEVMESIPLGATLIVKNNNCMSRRSRIDPAYAPMLAVGIAMQDSMAKVISLESEARPQSTLLTEEQRKDWAEFIRKHGEEFRTLMYPGAYDSIQAGLQFLSQKVAAAHENPAAKEAWEHYKFTVALTLKQQGEL